MCNGIFENPNAPEPLNSFETLYDEPAKGTRPAFCHSRLINSARQATTFALPIRRFTVGISRGVSVLADPVVRAEYRMPPGTVAALLRLRSQSAIEGVSMKT